MSKPDDKIEVQNVNHPDLTERVDRAKYEAMKSALLKTLPKGEPGMKAGDAREALLEHLDAELFPGGAKSGWWLKCVQLDLEAKGVIARADRKPLHLYRV